MIAAGYLEKPFKIIKADSGGIKCSVSCVRLFGTPYIFHLLSSECPHDRVYTMSFNRNRGTLLNVHKQQSAHFELPDIRYDENCTYDFLLTWFNDVIILKMSNHNRPSLIYSVESKSETGMRKLIGFIKFETCSSDARSIEWNVESPPFSHLPMKFTKKVDGGKLRWVKMTSGDMLPIDALIGGLQNEPLYIARALHMGSVCPGKYVRSKQLAFIAWGHQEHAKNEFEILCGYDAIWIRSQRNRIPENAFIGGYSEVNQEPLLIGRAWVDKNLIVGKVHLLYETCYLPYNDREIETQTYETLVVANKLLHGETSDPQCCYMNMNMQPCLKPV